MTDLTRKMLYLHSTFPKEDFLNADNLVRATLMAGGHRMNWRRPRKVTDNPSDLWSDNRDYILKHMGRGSGLDGVTFNGRHHDEEFHIWLNPKLDTETDYFHASLLHELTHGYIGPSKGHTHPWRTACSRAFFHYNWLVRSWDGETENLVHFNFKNYTAKSRSETDFDLNLRIHQEVESVREQAEEELPKVLDLYERLGGLIK